MMRGGGKKRKSKSLFSGSIVVEIAAV